MKHILTKSDKLVFQNKKKIYLFNLFIKFFSSFVKIVQSPSIESLDIFIEDLFMAPV